MNFYITAQAYNTKEKFIMSKKVSALTLAALLLCFALTACGTKNETGNVDLRFETLLEDTELLKRVAVSMSLGDGFMFVPKDDENEVFALFDVTTGKFVTDFKYSGAYDVFVGGYVILENLDGVFEAVGKDGKTAIIFDEQTTGMSGAIGV
jgi:hypothetical protein